MTGIKENQSTKGTLRRRRTNKQVQADILSAVGRILQEKDFTHITLMDIAREAKTDPNVVLRQFGSLEQVFDCYIRTIDYWMHDLFGNKALKRGERSALERMFARMTDFLYNSPEMQRLLVWEITDVNDTTCRAAANREGGGENAVPANRIVADRRYLLSRPPSAYFDIRRYGLRYAGRSGPTEKSIA